LHNVQDFAQILYFAGGVCIINKNNVFHSFFRPENHMSAFFLLFVKIICLVFVLFTLSHKNNKLNKMSLIMY
jgi:hypothetical protein